MEQNTLIEKLDGFIRKYYRNKCLRGLLITMGLFAAGSLFVSLTEYFAHFGVIGRTVLFYVFAFATSSVVIGLVVFPLLKLLRLGRIISYEEASSIVGDHFPEIKDKLLNTLQLQTQISSSHSPKDIGLLMASVARRTEQLRPVKFTSAIDFSGNLKYLKYSSIPLLIIVGILLWTPGVISEPAERIIQHRTAFEAPAPFRFELISSPLTVPKGEDFEFAVRIVGEVIPSTAYIVEAGGRYRMERLQGDIFRFVFTSVKEDLKFTCSANGWGSPFYTISALPVPGVLDYKIVASPPSYTGLDEIIQTNHGDLIVPEGTVITWDCRVVDADALGMRFADSTIAPVRVLGNLYSARWDARSSTPYWLIPSNKELGPVDSMRFSLGVVSDTRPVIRVVEVEDSLVRSLRYFTGSVGDDYGFTKLRFAVRQSTGKGDIQYFQLERPRGKSDDFFYTWNISDLGLSSGESLEYWFEVWDNDGVNGSKSTRSSSKVFSAPTEDELKEERDEANDVIETSIEDAVEMAEHLRLEVESFKERLREERELGWKDKKALEELLKKQEELKETLERLNKNNEKKNSRLNEFSEQDERILEKQEELQKLMEDVMSDELKELYERMRELLDDMSPEEIQEHLEKIDVGQDAMEKELDRALEQFKQLEWEVKMEEVISDLERLAEKQAKLAEEAESKEKTQEQLEKEQQELNDEFDQIQKDLIELRKQNAELQNPNSMMDSADEEKAIKEAQEKSSSDLEKGKKKKASESQKSAAEEMEALAKRMKSMQAEEEEEGLEEDMDALRSLLENIITLSFEEEFLMREIKTTDAQDPRYVEHGQTQRKLKDDAKMVEDSLYALSMRVRQLAGAVNREIGLVNHHMEKALGGFGNRETPMIAMNQQYVMTSFNNLALLLDEALQEMQNKQECKNPGTGNCNKPGGSGKKPSAKAGNLKKMQEALGKQLEEMKSRMGEGTNEGESNQRGGQMSQQLAEMAAQQAALRELAKQRANELNGDGSGEGEEMKRIAEEMEQLERDLVNRNVDAGTIERQREIITRLLEAEEADRVRGEKDERRSIVGNQGLHPETPQSIDYLNDRANEIELLKTIPVNLSPFYKDRVDDYFNTVTP